MTPDDTRATGRTIDAEPLLLGQILAKLDRIVSLLESINARLKEEREETARCAHGTTGMCMACVIQNDLLRPKQGRF